MYRLLAGGQDAADSSIARLLRLAGSEGASHAGRPLPGGSTSLGLLLRHHRRATFRVLGGGRWRRRRIRLVCHSGHLLFVY